MYSERLPNISVIRLLLTLALTIAAIVWVVGWSVNHDPLWFLPGFADTPSQITIYHRGEETTLLPGQPGFAELTAAFNEAFSHRQAWTPLGVSDGSADDYRRQEVALALHYDHAVTIRSPYRYGPYRSFFLPLTGRHSELHPVWGLDGEQIVAGAMLLASDTPLRQALGRLGLAP